MDEPLVELETDKVTLEVNATSAGVLKEIKVETGTNVEVGAVLGAIGEAGGPMYAADTSSVTLIRSEVDGSKQTLRLDLDKISHGQEADVPVKANDVVDVPYSNLRIGPYVFYSVLTRVGLSGPIPY